MAVSVAGLEDPLGNPALLALLAPPTPLAGANDNPRGLRWPRGSSLGPELPKNFKGSPNDCVILQGKYSNPKE